MINQDQLMEIIKRFGDLGVFIAMFLESSIVPIPSELIVIGAGAIGVSIASIVIFGSLGALLGGCVGYSIGRFGALPVIIKYGKYIFIKPEYIKKAEAFAMKYGAISVLIGRLLPIIPFKVFSITSGLCRINFVVFVIYTFIGVIPRMFLLAMFGLSMVKYTKWAALAAVAAVILYVIYKKYWAKKIAPVPPLPGVGED